MGTPVKNFAKATVSGLYSSSDLTITLSTGHGSKLSATGPYPVVWWDSFYSDPADDPNREICTCGSVSGDTVTLSARGQEGTTATAKNTAGRTYKMLQCPTALMWEDLEARSLSQTFRGLSLRTHPNSNEAAAKVMLVHADSIVMNDGEEISGWDRLVASLALSGIGGLDSGTEQASTLYEIYAAYNRTTVTKGLFLHRAKNYALHEYTTGEDATQGLRSAVDNSTVRISQGFQHPTAGPLEMIDVKLIKVGAPTGNFWFTLEANSGGVPSNTALATSDKYDASRLTTTATWVRIPFRDPYSISAATQYHLVMHGDYTISATNYVGWRMDGTAASYASGSKALYDSDGPSWTSDTDDDMLFKAYVSENEVAVSGTAPAGYSQHALVGYCINDASSNLVPFEQKDRTVFGGQSNGWQVGSLSGGTPQLIDLRALLPPVELAVEFQDYSGSVHVCSAGSLSTTDLTTTTADEPVGAVKWYNPGTVEASGLMSVSKYSGIMWLTNGGTVDLYIKSFEW